MNNSIRTTKCKNCRSTLAYETKRKQFFCSYCRSKIVITDEEVQQYMQIDEARKKAIESDKQEKIHRLELISQEIEKQRKKILQKIKCPAIIAGIGGLFIFLGIVINFILLSVIGLITLIPSIIVCYYLYFKSERINTSSIVASYGGHINIPAIARCGTSYYYDFIFKVLKDAGFTNIICIPVSISSHFFKTDRQVESIEVGQCDIKNLPLTRIDPNTSIVIKYYSENLESAQ